MLRASPPLRTHSRAWYVLAIAALSCGAPRPPDAVAAPIPDATPRPLPPLPAELRADPVALAQGPASRFLGVERAAAKSAPGEASPARDFAAAVERVLDDPATNPGAADARALVAEALAVLDAALAGRKRGPEQLFLATRRAALDARAGHGDEALAALDALLADHPNLYSLDAYFKVAAATGKRVDVTAQCARVRPEIRREIELLVLLERCMAEAHATRPEVGLAWASADDRELYLRDRAARAAREQRLHDHVDEELRDAPPGADAGAPRW